MSGMACSARGEMQGKQKWSDHILGLSQVLKEYAGFKGALLVYL